MMRETDSLFEQLTNLLHPFQRPPPLYKSIGAAKGGFRGAVTHSGLPIDQAKSALQKAIRFCQCHQALQASFELYRMEDVGDVGKQTNMFNLLAVLALEDIGIGNLPLALTVLRELILKDNRRPEMLALLVQALCSAEKTRIASHLYNAYARPQGRCVAAAYGIVVDDLDSNELAEMVGTRLLAKDPRAIYWADRFVNASENKTLPKGSRHARKGAGGNAEINILWDALKEAGLPGAALEIFRQSYWDRRNTQDARIFWLVPVTALLYSLPAQDYESRQIPAKELASVAGLPGLEHLMRGQLAPLVMDEAAIDVHTAQGKRQGRTKYDFATIGAQVRPLAKLPRAPTLPDSRLLEHVYEQSKLVETLSDPDTIKLLQRTAPARIEELKRSLEFPNLLADCPGQIKAKAPKRTQPESPKLQKESLKPQKSESLKAPKRQRINCQGEFEIAAVEPQLEPLLKLGVTPLGQVPTSKTVPTVGSHKKLVFMLPDFVYKGPFGLDNAADCAALSLIFERQALLKRFRDDIALMSELVQVGPVYYLRSRNIATTLPEQWKTEERSTKAGTFTVVKRDSLGFVKLVDYDPNRIGKFFLPLLKHLIAATVLDPPVGDLVLSNFLVAGEVLFAIDYEERRGSLPKQGQLWDWLFSKRPSSAIIQQLDHCISPNCQALFDFVDRLRNQPINLERLETIRALLVSKCSV